MVSIASRWGSVVYVEDSDSHNLASAKVGILTASQGFIQQVCSIKIADNIHTIRVLEIPAWEWEMDQGTFASTCDGSVSSNDNSLDNASASEGFDNSSSHSPQAQEVEDNSDPFDISSQIRRQGEESRHSPPHAPVPLSSATSSHGGEESLEFPPGFPPCAEPIDDAERDDPVSSKGCSIGTTTLGSDHETFNMELKKTVEIGVQLGYDMDSMMESLKNALSSGNLKNQ